MQKILLALVVFSASLSAQAAEPAPAKGFDGCFQLYVPGSMYPKICLRGTLEEGIGGSGVRLAIFHTNTENMEHCVKSTASGINGSTYTFEVDGRKEMILVVEKLTEGRREGKVTFGKTTLDFMEFDDKYSEHLQGLASASSLCQ